MIRSAVFAALAITLVLMASPSRGHAQEQAFQSYEAGAWFLTSLELTLLAEVPLSLAVAGGSDPEKMLLCGMFFPFCVLFAPRQAFELLVTIAVFALDALAAIVIPSVTAGVADGTDAPVDFPAVFNPTFASTITFAFLGGGIGLAAGAPEVGGLVGGVLGLGGALTYTILRLDALARDPRLGVEMNFLTWGPAVVGPLTALLLAASGADPAVALLVSGLAAMLTMVGSVIAIEVELAQPAPMTAPLIEIPLPRL